MAAPVASGTECTKTSTAHYVKLHKQLRTTRRRMERLGRAEKILERKTRPIGILAPSAGSPPQPCVPTLQPLGMRAQAEAHTPD